MSYVVTAIVCFALGYAARHWKDEWLPRLKKAWDDATKSGPGMKP